MCKKFRDKTLWNWVVEIFDYCTSSVMVMSLIFWIWAITCLLMLVSAIF